MQTIKNIIFDYGNVIFKIDFSRTQQAFERLGVKDVAQKFAHTNQSSLFDNFDKGLISIPEFRNGIRQMAAQKQLTDAQIDEAWNSLLIGVPNSAYHDILLNLKSQYRTFLLSNNNELHYNYILNYLKQEFGFESNSHLFEKDYYSHLMQMRKPDADIFEFVLNTHQLKAKETLFIDDSPQHIATAQRLGLHTHLMLPEDDLPFTVSRLLGLKLR